MRTVFDQIIQGELPSKKIFENERLLVIEDRHPQAPIHFLILPKKGYANLQCVPKEDLLLMAEIVEVAQNLAKTFGVADNYRLLTNNGREAGQSVFYLHFHLIGGKKLGPIA